MSQFTGLAGRSVVIGIIGIVVPIAWILISGNHVFFFYLLPILGIIYGVIAITRGLVIGGVTGVILNVVAGLVSLFMASLTTQSSG